MTLKVALADGSRESVDHEATWLFGHTERIAFSRPTWRGGTLTAAAVIHIPCHFAAGEGEFIRCQAHGFEGRVRRRPIPAQPRRLNRDRFRLIRSGRLTTVTTRPEPSRRQALPIIESANPCAAARCRTSDNTVGAACCRDLQISVLCRAGTLIDQLVRSRRSPYLCKVEREGPDSLGAEMISACRYLDDHGVLCSLHGRTRPDGRTAKPDLCFEWPERDDHFHAGCAFNPLG